MKKIKYLKAHQTSLYSGTIKGNRIDSIPFCIGVLISAHKCANPKSTCIYHAGASNFIYEIGGKLVVNRSFLTFSLTRNH